MNALFGEDIVEPDVAIRADPALVVGQMFGGIPAFPIFAKPAPGGWRIVPSSSSFIAHIGPGARGRAFFPGLHLDWGVIRKDGRACVNKPTDGLT